MKSVAGIIGCCALLACTQTARADLLLAAPPDLLTNAQQLVLYGAPGIGGNVSFGATSIAYTIGNAGSTTVQLPASAYLSANGSAQAGIRVTWSGTVGALWQSYSSSESGLVSAELTAIHDAARLGTDYYVMAGGPGPIGEGSQVSIVAREDGTQVTLTPRVALPGHPAGTPFTVTLNANEAVKFASSVNDLTGTAIASNKPIAVFGGSQCGNRPGDSFCHFEVEQNPSLDKLGTSYVVAPIPGVTNVVRIMGTTAGTMLSYSPAHAGAPATVNDGAFAEASNFGAGQIVSNQPIMVGEYMSLMLDPQMIFPTSYPAFAVLPSTDQWLAQYAIATPEGIAAADQNFLNVVIETADTGSVVLDGASVSAASFSTLAGTAYSFANLAIAPGVHNISAADKMQVLLVGIDPDGSYLTIAGAAFSPGPGVIKAVPEPATWALLLAGLLVVAYRWHRRGARPLRAASERQVEC